MTITIPRAVRNNNPGNIRVGDPWQGLVAPDAMTDAQKLEKEFCVFQSPKWGFRALARVLISYKDKYAINTIAGVIGRWAPTNENDTAAYIAHVATLCERGEDDPVDLHSYDDLRPICKAISIHETGSWLWEDEDLDTGLRLAGVEPPVKALTQSRTLKAAIGSSIVTVPAIVDAVQQIKPAIDTISQIKEYAPTVALVICLVAAAVITYARIDDWLHAKR